MQVRPFTGTHRRSRGTSCAPVRPPVAAEGQSQGCGRRPRALTGLQLEVRGELWQRLHLRRVTWERVFHELRSVPSRYGTTAFRYHYIMVSQSSWHYVSGCKKAHFSRAE